MDVPQITSGTANQPPPGLAGRYTGPLRQAPTLIASEITSVPLLALQASQTRCSSCAVNARLAGTDSASATCTIMLLSWQICTGWVPKNRSQSTDQVRRVGDEPAEAADRALVAADSRGTAAPYPQIADPVSQHLRRPQPRPRVVAGVEAADHALAGVERGHVQAPRQLLAPLPLEHRLHHLLGVRYRAADRAVLVGGQPMITAVSARTATKSGRPSIRSTPAP